MLSDSHRKMSPKLRLLTYEYKYSINGQSRLLKNKSDKLARRTPDQYEEIECLLQPGWKNLSTQNVHNNHQTFLFRLNLWLPLGRILFTKT